MRKPTILFLLPIFAATLGLLGLGLELTTGCGSPCVDYPLNVQVYADTTAGAAPLTVNFMADGEGRRCGCCGSDGSSEIARWDWDFDNDGTIDESGANLDEVSHTFDATGEHIVRVIVTDTRNATEMAQITITVE